MRCFRSVYQSTLVRVHSANPFTPSNIHLLQTLNELEKALPHMAAPPPSAVLTKFKKSLSFLDYILLNTAGERLQ